MSEEATAQQSDRRGTESARGYYVYGIVPADVQVASSVRGVGEPPASVDVIGTDDLAALVSEVSIDRPLGTPEDLIAHERVLDTAAETAPVLPLRFGAVLSDPDAIVSELLEPHQEEFTTALHELEGRAEYVVKGRYDQATVLREVLQEVPEAAELRKAIAGSSEDATRDARIQLGELVNSAIEAKRDADTDVAVKRLRSSSVSVAVREPTHEEDAVHLALLVETARQDELEQAVAELREEWGDRVSLRLLGPLAPFDFVVKTEA